MVLSEALQAVAALKRCRTFGLSKNPSFTAHDSRIEELEEWCSLWASEAGTQEDNDPIEKACIEMLDRAQLDHRPYA